MVLAALSYRHPTVGKIFGPPLTFMYYPSMKMTIDILDSELEDVIRFSGAKTKREAVVTAVAEYNRRGRLAELTRHAGTCSGLITAEELQAERRKN